MKWYWKLVIILGVLILLGIIASMIYVVSAKYKMNDYAADLGACFDAAALVSSGEIVNDPEKSVIASYGGKSHIIHPGLYKKLSFYLRSQAAPPLFGKVDKENCLRIVICGQSILEVQFDSNGEEAMVSFDSAGKHYLMHISANCLRDQLLTLCTTGYREMQNQAVD